MADHVVEMTERRHSATRSRRSGAELKVYVEFCYLNGAGREVPIKINETTDRGLLRFSRDFLFLHYIFFSVFFRFLFYFTTGFSYISSEAFTRIYTAITKSRTFRWLLWPRSKSHSASLSSNASEKPEGGSSLGTNRFPDPSRSCSRLA